LMVRSCSIFFISSLISTSSSPPSLNTNNTFPPGDSGSKRCAHKAIASDKLVHCLVRFWWSTPAKNVLTRFLSCVRGRIPCASPANIHIPRLACVFFLRRLVIISFVAASLLTCLGISSTSILCETSTITMTSIHAPFSVHPSVPYGICRLASKKQLSAKRYPRDFIVNFSFRYGRCLARVKWCR
jgi:hypothetical protein